jgi:hypothetical protein
LKAMWEILVPASNHKDKFSYDHHKEWDAFVRQFSDGITVLRGAKGEWKSPDGTVFKDRMIPVRIICTEEDIKRIVRFTIEHYNQEAVLAYMLSNTIILEIR